MLGYILTGIGAFFLGHLFDRNDRANKRNEYYLNEIRELTYEKKLKEENALKIFNERKNELTTFIKKKG